MDERIDDDFDFLERNVWAEMSPSPPLNRRDKNSLPSSGGRNEESDGEKDMTQLHLHLSPVSTHSATSSNSAVSPTATKQPALSSKSTPNLSNLDSPQRSSPLTSRSVNRIDQGDESLPTDSYSVPPAHADIETERIVVPPLVDLISAHDRVGFAALCYLILHDMAYRYSRYEYIGPSVGGAERTRLNDDELEAASSSKEFSRRFRRKSQESRSLLHNFDNHSDTELDGGASETGPSNRPLFFADFEKSTSRDFPDVVSTSVLDMFQASQGNMSSSSHLSAVDDSRVPFGEHMNNPESIHDTILFGRSLDGNILLCGALKQTREWAFLVMDLFYGQLQIDPQEKHFIEQGVEIGLQPDALIAALSFISDSAKTANGQTSCSDLVRNIMWNVLMIVISATGTKYTSTGRVFFKQLAMYLNLNWFDVIEMIEAPYISSISSEEETDETDGYLRRLEEIERHNQATKILKKAKRKRVFYMTAAALGGGAIIGITTGLAAPLMGAGIGAALAAMKIAGASTFFGSVGGTALITSGGVLTGSGIAGRKMEKRTRQLEYFKFIPIGGDGANIIICVSGWLQSRDGKGKDVPSRQRSQTDSDTSMKSRSALTSRNAFPGGSRETAKAADSASISEEPSDPTFEGQTHGADDILATGLQDLMTPFMGLSPLNGRQYSLIFDPRILKSLGDSLKLFASEVLSFSANQLLAQTMLSTLMAGLTWPMWLCKLGYLVDNPWSMGLDRSRKAGKVLAENIKNCGRSVSLVGYSLGARTIYYCLLELAKNGCFGLIEDVFMFGTPIMIPPNSEAFDTKQKQQDASKNREFIVDPDQEPLTSPNRQRQLDDWRMITSVVSGRFVNAFSRTDWVLGFLFRASAAGMYDVAGLRPVLLDSSGDVRYLDDYLDGVYIPGLAESKAAAEKVATESNSEKEKSELPPKEVRLPQATPTRVAVVENIDITKKIDGHFAYRTTMPSLVKQVCGFCTWTEDFEVIEEVIGGDWLETVDGWWSEDRKKRKRGWSNFSAGSSTASIKTPSRSQEQLDDPEPDIQANVKDEKEDD